MIKAEYIAHMGTDDFVCDAARVSFDKSAAQYTPEQNAKLIRYLAKHGHWTPAAHPQITLRETVPIFVARQRTKHAVGFVVNEVSRRYVDHAPEFYVPDQWRRRPDDDNIKQGSGGAHAVQDDLSNAYTNLMYELTGIYNGMIAGGIAPEQARMVLPQSMLTSYYVTGSLAAFARAYKQRSDSHAQHEIQALAQQWDDIIAPLFPIAWRAFAHNDA